MATKRGVVLVVRMDVGGRNLAGDTVTRRSVHRTKAEAETRLRDLKAREAQLGRVIDSHMYEIRAKVPS